TLERAVGAIPLDRAKRGFICLSDPSSRLGGEPSLYRSHPSRELWGGLCARSLRAGTSPQGCAHAPNADIVQTCHTETPRACRRYGPMPRTSLTGPAKVYSPTPRYSRLPKRPLGSHAAAWSFSARLPPASVKIQWSRTSIGHTSTQACACHCRR